MSLFQIDKQYINTEHVVTAELRDGDLHIELTGNRHLWIVDRSLDRQHILKRLQEAMSGLSPQ